MKIVVPCQCGLLIIFPNSLDPDQARQDVGPDLDPNCLSLIVFLKDFLLILKKSAEDKKACKITQHANVTGCHSNTCTGSGLYF